MLYIGFHRVHVFPSLNSWLGMYVATKDGGNAQQRLRQHGERSYKPT
jgi:hypothetical protein